MTQEEQKVQELLKPRVKVVAPWPEMERWLARVGDILTDPGGNETVRNQNGDAVPAFEWETFPHLFRKLEWHEERDASEMPEYVKFNLQSSYATYGIIKKIVDFKCTKSGFGIIHHDGGTWWAKDCIPATAADYHAYKQPA